MALTGTLEDFGIAEILQLIGQQAKSGVLHLTSREDQIHVLLSDGCVVSAEYAGRKQKERLGALLVRAELLRPEDLERALEAQRRTLRRLGDLLVELKLVSRDDLKAMTALQTNETVFRLFSWKSGTYAFEPGAVEWDRETVTPLKAESLLMEGYRRIDEWPMVQKRITPGLTFVRRGALPPPEAPDAPGDDGVDAAFDALGADAPPEGGGVSPQERRVHALVEPGRTVEAIVDLSRLGEFEAKKALLGLLNRGLLEAVAPPRRSAAAEVSAFARTWKRVLGRGAAGAAATALLAALLAGAGWLAAEREAAAAARAGVLEEGAARRFLARWAVTRLGDAVDVWRLEHGEPPPTLGALVEAGLVRPRDLSYPFAEPYYYRRTPDGGFILLPPLP